MKKLLSVLIAFSMLLSLAVPFSSYADDGLYGYETAYETHSESGVLNGKTYYSMGLELYNYLKAKLENRTNSFELYIIYNTSIDSKSKREDVLLDAYIGATFDGLSKSTVDGDYLLWAVEDFKAVSAVKDAEKDGKYYYTFTAEFSYYDTLSEERKVDSAVSVYLDTLDLNSKTDVQIIRAVHDYICKNTKYDTAAAKNPEGKFYAWSPYGALIKGSCVCQGYATAFYRICRELGYKVRFVSSDPLQGCHAWNIIGLDNKYYVVDCMWNDSVLDGRTDEYAKDYFFLTDYAGSQKYDKTGEHLLYSYLYENNYFEYNYKQAFAAVPYAEASGNRLSACTVTLSATSFVYTGSAFTPSVKITCGGKELKEGTDYSLSYSSNVNIGAGRVDITGLGDYAGTSTHRQFVITPPQAQKVKVKKINAKSAVLSWNKTDGATGYEIQLYSGEKWSVAGNSTSCTFKVKNLSPAKKYKFRIRAYKTVNRRHYYSKTGKYAACCTKPSAVKIKNVSGGKKSVTVKWKKAKSTGYQLQVSANKSFKSAKTVRVKYGRVSKTVKKLKANKKYYVRIRAYKTYKNENGKTKTVYGAWSAKKSVKTK